MNSKIKNFLLLLFPIIICLLSSCAFNKIFLRPNTFPHDLKEMTIKTPNDTIKIFFNGNNHQPVFKNHNGNDSIVQSFSIESVVYKSTNGDSLHGWFLKPVNQIPKYTILHLHGNGGSVLSQYRAISPLLSKGFQVFIFDYSGFGFSTGKSTRKNALTDALSSLDYLKSRPEVLGTKIIIYGQSFGGHLAAVVGAQRQKDIDGLVLEGAFSSAKDIAASRMHFIGRLLVKQMYAASKSIKDYHKPLLIIHSTEDHVVPFYMGQKLFKLANEPKEFYEINKCHICGPTFYADEIADKIKAMLK